MPIDLGSATLSNLIASGAFESHTTLDVVLSDLTEIHIATAELAGVNTENFGSQDYTADLRESGTLTQSMTISTDRIDLSAQNILAYTGSDFALSGTLNGAAAILSTVFIDSTGTMFQVELLHGSITNASEEDSLTKFQVVSYLSLSGPIGGFRTLQKHCPWRYKHSGCDSPDSKATCDHTFDGDNGCKFHLPAVRINNPTSVDNTPSYSGFPFVSPTAPGSITINTASFDDKTDFSNYDRSINGGYAGRYQIPDEFYALR